MLQNLHGRLGLGGSRDFGKKTICFEVESLTGSNLIKKRATPKPPSLPPPLTPPVSTACGIDEL